MRCSPGLRSSRAAEEDGLGSRFQQHDGVRMVEKPPTPSAGSKQWEPHKGREKREISRRLCCIEKGSPPPLYIVLRGGAPSLPFPCGTNPTRKKGGEVAGHPRGPCGPWRHPLGACLPFSFSPHGTHMAHMPLALLFNYLNHYFNI